MMFSAISSIDVHAHYGRYVRGAPDDLINELMSADAEEVLRRAELANIGYAIVSPLQALLPRGSGDPVAGNMHAAELVQHLPGLLQYVVIDPREPRTFDQADEMLRQPRCVGPPYSSDDEYRAFVRLLGERLPHWIPAARMENRRV